MDALGANLVKLPQLFSSVYRCDKHTEGKKVFSEKFTPRQVQVS